MSAERGLFAERRRVLEWRAGRAGGPLAPASVLEDAGLARWEFQGDERHEVAAPLSLDALSAAAANARPDDANARGDANSRATERVAGASAEGAAGRDAFASNNETVLNAARIATSARSPLPAAILQSLSQDSRAALGRFANAPSPRFLTPNDVEVLLQSLRARAEARGAQASDFVVQQGVQHVLAGSEDELRTDLRSWAIVEMRASHPERGSLWRCAALGDADAFVSSPLPVERMDALLDSLLLPTHPCPTGDFPIVLAEGSAATCFVHEVCGHPLEGDVVMRRGSYLSERLGKRVAPEFLTVTDGPANEPEGFACAIDDEGTPAATTLLFENGVVRSPLLDRRTARALKLQSNGHGRRVGFRQTPLPRMHHTKVHAGHESLPSLLAGITRGLYVQHLLPRHMNLLSGDFSFTMSEARWIENGRLGERVLPGVLSGNGLTALGALEALGDNSRAIMSTRGCRKLEHGPLRISFGQPAVRFSSLRVSGGE